MKGFDRGLRAVKVVVNEAPVIRPVQAHTHDANVPPGLHRTCRIKVQRFLFGEVLAHDQFTAKGKRGVPGPGQAEFLHGSVPVRRPRVTARRVMCSRLARPHLALALTARTPRPGSSATWLGP